MDKTSNAEEFLDLHKQPERCIQEHYDVPNHVGPVA